MTALEVDTHRNCRMRVAMSGTWLPLIAPFLNVLIPIHQGSPHRKGGSCKPKQEMGLEIGRGVSNEGESWNSEREEVLHIPSELDLRKQIIATVNSVQTGNARSLDKTHYSRRRK